MTTAEREKYIWDHLAAAGMTPAGAAGLMGNLYTESGLDPCNLQNTSEKKLGLTDAVLLQFERPADQSETAGSAAPDTDRSILINMPRRPRGPTNRRRERK